MAYVLQYMPLKICLVRGKNEGFLGVFFLVLVLYVCVFLRLLTTGIPTLNSQAMM